jgi:serine/threonine protein kinase
VDQVGSYELLGCIAETNTGNRWRGRDIALGREVLLRQVRQVTPIGAGGAGGVGGAGALATIAQPRSGLRFLAGLSHPNIVSLLDKIEADGQVWFVDEPADGVTLEAVLAGPNWPTAPQSFGIVRGVLKGLAYVHNSRALHGDISPSTVLLDHRGTARLGDFGRPSLAGVAADVQAQAFRSPEAANGLGVSARSDVYSVGVVLATLLRGDLDPRTRALLDHAMAKDPTDRFLDAEEFLQALEDVAEERFGETWLADASVVELVPV